MTFTLLHQIVMNNVPNLFPIIHSLQISAKIIQKEINLHNIHHKHNYDFNLSTNSSGDNQQSLDIFSNNIIIHYLTLSHSCHTLLSEENDTEITIPTEFSGNYQVCFDPLDGSSNIDCKMGLGTIFSISPWTGSSLKSGRDIICSGYFLYGPSTELVIAFTGQNPYHFTLDISIGEFYLINQLSLPSNPKKIYCINESNSANWPPHIQSYISLYKTPDTKYTQRYVGSMVADIHRTILYGGNFLYPSDSKNKLGKLRILYECFPISHIIEQANGTSITGEPDKLNILDIIPIDIHQKTPIALGSTPEILKLIDCINQSELCFK